MEEKLKLAKVLSFKASVRKAIRNRLTEQDVKLICESLKAGPDGERLTQVFLSIVNF